MTVDRFIANYWGKARPVDGNGPRFHPNAYHGLDVAAAADALLSIRPQWLTTLARMAGLAEDVVRRWLLFALALHDLGKFTCAFQCKVPDYWYRKGMLPGGPKTDLGHGSAGYSLWQNGCKRARSAPHPFTSLFSTANPRVAASTARMFGIWFAAVCGHHGKPVETSDLNDRICDAALDDARDFVLACAQLFSPAPTGNFAIPREYDVQTSSWLIAGIAMLADWIGSNQEWFDYHEPTLTLPQYWDEAGRRAKNALNKSGLTAALPAQVYTLSDALPEIAEPEASPLQAWALRDAPIRGQSLIVIEDLTGAGKTEAALILAHRLMHAGAAEGLYWALPTMATADALYGRLAKSYARLFANPEETSLVLAHSSREFNEIFRKSIKLTTVNEPIYPGECDDRDEAIPGTAACARWIADDRRKTFLADVGVGTIDQALLGILPSKHQAMRLASLSRRVLVIDEIHSFDPYQNSLVERLLEFHAALGGSAILISATLAHATRQKLAKAFSQGTGWEIPLLTASSFPLATLLSEARKSVEEPLDSSRGTRRDLPVERLENEEAAYKVLEDAARDGRAAVWIRNTVQDAIEAHKDLKERLPDYDVGLFHARFALGDRLRIQEGVLANFGKKSEGRQRKRILVATQVVEQSIDADWDVMITDLAPIDLLIQRAGRLHRHERSDKRPSPILQILSPEPSEDADANWYAKTFPRAQWVYADHGQLWLTIKALTQAGGLNLQSASPRDLIEFVFGGNSPIPKGLEKVSGKADGEALSQRAVGRMNGLKLDKGYVHQAGSWDSDDRTPTRLGEPSRTLRLARWDGKTLKPWWPVERGDERRAWRLSEVSVRAATVKDVIIGDAMLDRAIKAEISKWPERYDPPLLIPLVERQSEWWHAKILHNDGQPRNLRYSVDFGLTLLSCSPHARG